MPNLNGSFEYREDVSAVRNATYAGFENGSFAPDLVPGEPELRMFQ